MKKGLAVPAGSGNRFGNWPMIARATRLFHDRPYFSHVAIQMEAAGEDPVTSYGQLRLLFTCTVLTQVENKVTKELAFVHLYESLGVDRVTQCEVLHPMLESMDVGSSSDNVYRRRRRDPYMVVDTMNILRVIHLVPHFGQRRPNEYLINRFKF